MKTSPLSIILTCPCDVNPITPHFYITRPGFTGVYIILSSPEPSPEPKAHRLALAPASVVVVVIVVVNHFQTSSPPKPVGQSKPNFMWSLLGKGERKFILMLRVE